MEDILNALALLTNFVLLPAAAYGSQLALGALGVTLVYGILRFSNFAHGDTMAFGTMIAILFTWWLQAQGVNLGFLPTALLAIPFAVLATVAFMLLCDRWVYRYHRVKKAPAVVFLICSVGVMFLLNGIVRFVIGPGEQHFADGERFIFTVVQFREFTGLEQGVSFRTSQALTLVSALLIVVLVSRAHPHRQVDARLLRQRELGAALGHQPRPRGADHLGAGGGAGHRGRGAVRARQGF